MIRIGSTVRVKGKTATAKVEQRMKTIEGGCYLDRSLEGFRFWNITDLEHIKQRRKKRK